MLEALKEQVLKANLELPKHDLVTFTWGNVSAIDRASGLIAIKPSSRPYDLLRPEDITVIDPMGKVVEGPYRPSSEWPMHTRIYRTFPRVCGIVHCHSIYATAAAAAGREIPLINHELSMYCSSPVRVAPFTVPGSEALGESAIAAFGPDNTVALLQNHGSVAMGATLWHAFDGVCAVEQAAHALYLCQGPFGPASLIPQEGREALRACDPLQRADTGGPVEITAV